MKIISNQLCITPSKIKRTPRTDEIIDRFRIYDSQIDPSILMLFPTAPHRPTVSRKFFAVTIPGFYSATLPRPKPPPNRGLSPSSRRRYSSPPSRRGGLYAPPSSRLLSPPWGAPSLCGRGALRCVRGTNSAGMCKYSRRYSSGQVLLIHECMIREGNKQERRATELRQG